MDKDERRFWDNVDKGSSDECWPWRGGCSGTEYGIFWNGEEQLLAHRYVWELVNGPIPKEHQVQHICDNRKCVNPKHLNLSGSREIIEESFCEKVDKRSSNECWIWRAGSRDGRYGSFWDGERMVVAHRYAWELANGPIPEGMCVCHKCDNPLCCNLGHLFLGTQLDNIADKVEKDRQAKGETDGNSKLTKEEVLEIRHRYTTEDITQKELAEDYCVGKTNIWWIVHHKTWKHI